MRGEPVRFSVGQDLHAWRGKLLEGGLRGRPVHAGSFLRRREVVLDAALLHDQFTFEHIVIHEVFHFVWARLGNPLRSRWNELLLSEHSARARGELGWSAEREKVAAPGSRAWRGYICESFCDTAAWYALHCRAHEDVTLASRFARNRKRWFQDRIFSRILSV